MDYIQDRNLKIDLLNIARGLLSVHEEDYICCAIARAAHGRSPCKIYRRIDFTAAVDSMRHYIMAALKPDRYYSTWISRNHPDLYQTWEDNAFKQGRIAWINWMIACYEEDIANYKENK